MVTKSDIAELVYCNLLFDIQGEKDRQSGKKKGGKRKKRNLINFFHSSLFEWLISKIHKLKKHIL